MTTTVLASRLAGLPGRCSHGYAAVQHPSLCQCSAAAAGKADGIARANDHAPDEVKRRIDAEIRRLAATGREFSANDCRKALAGVAGPVVGGRFNSAHRAGLIRKTGRRVPSNLASTHAHELLCWIGGSS